MIIEPVGVPIVKGSGKADLTATIEAAKKTRVKASKAEMETYALKEFTTPQAVMLTSQAGIKPADMDVPGKTLKIRKEKAKGQKGSPFITDAIAKEIGFKDLADMEKMETFYKANEGVLDKIYLVTNKQGDSTLQLNGTPITFKGIANELAGGADAYKAASSRDKALIRKHAKHPIYKWLIYNAGLKRASKQAKLMAADPKSMDEWYFSSTIANPTAQARAKLVRQLRASKDNKKINFVTTRNELIDKVMDGARKAANSMATKLTTDKLNYNIILNSIV